jgi:hypothetical protein
VETILRTRPPNPSLSHGKRIVKRVGNVKWNASNYAEARGAESDGHFVHKLKVVLKELNECQVWPALIERGSLLSADCLKKPQEDCTVVCRIIAASINTVKGRMKKEAGETAEGTGLIED